MNEVNFRKFLFAPLLLTFLLVSCSNPSRQKVKYLNDGQRSFQAGKYQEAVIQFRNALQIDPRLAAAHYGLGRTYLMLNNFESAYRELSEAVTLEPNNFESQLELAKVLVGRRQHAESQAIARKVLAADPKNSRAHVILAENHALGHDFASAISEFRKAIELDPQRVETYGALGSLYVADGKFAEAEATYKQAISIAPQSMQARLVLGHFYFSRGELDKAEAEMAAASQLGSDAAPRVFRGRIFVRMGRLAEAEGVYRELKTVAPNDPEAYQALGIFYASTGQREKAVQEFQSVAAAQPKDLSVKAHLLELLLDLNRLGDAAKLDQEIQKNSPDDPRTAVSHARILLTAGRSQEAMAVLQKHVKADPKSVAGYYYLAVTQQALGLLEAAKGSLARTLELSPQMAQASVALANLQVKSGNAVEAQRLAGDALKAQPGLPSAHLASGLAAIANGETVQGEAELQEAVKRDPTSLRALLALMRFSIEHGKAAAVVQQFSGLAQQYPNNAGLHFLLGLGYFHLKDLDRSEASVKQALSLDARTPQAHSLLANIAFAKGDVERAKENLRQAIAANPRLVSNYIALAAQYERERNWQEAKQLYTKAHELDPASAVASAELVFLHLEHGGDVNLAVSLAQDAKQKLPNSPMTTDALGWAYYKLGSTNSAITHLKESVQQMPGNPMYQYHLGMAYLAAGKLDLSQRCLQASLKLDPNFLNAPDAKSALAKIMKGRD